MFNPHESLTEAVCSMEFQISNMIQKNLKTGKDIKIYVCHCWDQT